jgi:hypothetical protein
MMVVIVLMVMLMSLGRLRGVRYFLRRRGGRGSERHRRQLQQGRNGE